TGGTVSGIPADTQSFEPSAIDTLEASEYPFDVIVEDLARLDGAGPVVPVARRRQSADRLDVGPEKRPALEHHLEAVVVGGVVAAGDLDAPVDLVGGSFGVIEHRRRPQADPPHIASARRKSLDQRVLEHRGADTPVVADRDHLAASATQKGRETAADRSRVVGSERLADDAAYVVFAHDGGVELVRHQVSKRAGDSSSNRSRAALAS